MVLDDALGTGVPVSDITCVGLPDTSSSSSSPSYNQEVWEISCVTQDMRFPLCSAGGVITDTNETMLHLHHWLEMPIL